MSVNFDRAPSKWTTNNREYKYLSLYDLDPYNEECWGHICDPHGGHIPDIVLDTKHQIKLYIFIK